MDQRPNFHGKTARVAVAGAVATGMLTLFAALGGAGMAHDEISASQYQYGKKTTICHKGKKTISVGNPAVPAHLRHGDTIGPCSSAAAKAKKAKLKAAKLKAAKLKAAKAKAAKAKAAKAEAAKAEHTAEAGKSGKPNPGRGKGK